MQEKLSTGPAPLTEAQRQIIDRNLFQPGLNVIYGSQIYNQSGLPGVFRTSPLGIDWEKITPNGNKLTGNLASFKGNRLWWHPGLFKFPKERFSLWVSIEDHRLHLISDTVDGGNLVIEYLDAEEVRPIDCLASGIGVVDKEGFLYDPRENSDLHDLFIDDLRRARKGKRLRYFDRDEYLLKVAQPGKEGGLAMALMFETGPEDEPDGVIIELHTKDFRYIQEGLLERVIEQPFVMAQARRKHFPWSLFR